MQDYFERLGLPRRFAVDRSLLEREYLARSRTVHPDFHSGDDGKTAETAQLNEAYLALKDPFRRAEYYLALLGGPSARDDKGQDQAFLMEMMELREQIDSATAEQKDDIATDLNSRLGESVGSIAKQFQELETGQPTPQALATIRKQLNGAKTLQSLVRSLTDEPE